MFERFFLLLHVYTDIIAWDVCMSVNARAYVLRMRVCIWKCVVCVRMFVHTVRCERWGILKMAAPIIVTRESKRRNEYIHKATYIERRRKNSTRVQNIWHTQRSWELSMELELELQFHNRMQSKLLFMRWIIAASFFFLRKFILMQIKIYFIFGIITCSTSKMKTK